MENISELLKTREALDDNLNERNVVPDQPRFLSVLNSYHFQTERFENLLNYYYTFMYLFQWLLDFLLLLVSARGGSPFSH